MQNLINLHQKLSKIVFFAKIAISTSGVDVFLISESPKNLLQNFESQYFKFIIFISIIMLEKLKILEFYQKYIELSISVFWTPNLKSKIQIQHRILNNSI